VIDVVEEASYIKEKYTHLKTPSVGVLHVVDQGQARIQTRRMGPSSELIGVNKLMLDNVMLHALSDSFLKQLA
jgi:hypothetical protein